MWESVQVPMRGDLVTTHSRPFALLPDGGQELAWGANRTKVHDHYTKNGYGGRFPVWERNPLNQSPANALSGFSGWPGGPASAVVVKNGHVLPIILLTELTIWGGTTSRDNGERDLARFSTH